MYAFTNISIVYIKNQIYIVILIHQSWLIYMYLVIEILRFDVRGLKLIYMHKKRTTAGKLYQTSSAFFKPIYYFVSGLASAFLFATIIILMAIPVPSRP